MRTQRDNVFSAGWNYSRRHGGISLSVNFRRTPTRTRASEANPIPELRSQSPPESLYTERHESAASCIQLKWRIHRSLRTVNNVSLEFQTLKSGFEYPDVIDFQMPRSEEGHISVHIPSDVEEVEVGEGEASVEVDEPHPKLAHTSGNYPIHSYMEEMEKLLMRLDEIESWGDEGVREKRRAVAREIGKESAKLERYWKQVWLDYVEELRDSASKENKEKEAQTEEIVEEAVVDVEDEDDDEWFEV
jgi:hypothetical protein